MRNPRLAVLPIPLLLVLGCGAKRFFEHEPQVRSIDEVGSVRAAVLTVEEWEEYVDALTPGFKLSGDQALAKVVPDTRLLDERRLRASRTELQVGFPTLAAGANPGDRPVEVPATTEGLDTSGSAAGSRTAEGLGAIAPLAATNLDGVDPMMSYTAANALYQEVQLLNRAIRDAAQRDGYVPYVVRMQVGLMTHRRNLPYDVYANLSFFTKDVVESLDEDWAGSGDLGLPYVIPLLVSDSLEATTHSVSLGSLVEVAAALQGFLGTTAFGFDQKLTKEDLERALGRNLNSLFMVSRLSDNTVRLRIGAHQQIVTNLAAVPRNHTLTLLMLVPEGSAVPKKEMTILARTEMLHVRTGKPLAWKGRERERRDVSRIIDRFELCKFEADGDAEDVCEDRESLVDAIDQAFFAAVDHDWPEFRRLMRPATLDPTDLLQIWSELVNLSPGYYEDELTFEIPDPGRAEFPKQAVALVDDTKKATVVRVVGGRKMRASRLCAALHFTEKAAGGVAIDPARTLFILPTNVAVDSRGEVATLTFESLKALGLANYAAEDAKGIRLQTAYAKTEADRSNCWARAVSLDWKEVGGTEPLQTRYHATASTPAPAGFKVTFQPSHVSADAVAKTGTLVFDLEPSKPPAVAASKAVVKVQGASIVSVDPAVPVPSEETFEIPLEGKKKRVKVKLQNLVVGKSFTVELTNGKEKEGTHAIEVR